MFNSWTDTCRTPDNRCVVEYSWETEALSLLPGYGRQTGSHLLGRGGVGGPRVFKRVQEAKQCCLLFHHTFFLQNVSIFGPSPISDRLAKLSCIGLEYSPYETLQGCAANLVLKSCSLQPHSYITFKK